MSDIENASDDDDRSINSDNSDYVDKKMKEFNKPKGIPTFEEASTDEGSDNSDDENDEGDDDDGSLSSVSDMEEMDGDEDAPKPAAPAPSKKSRNKKETAKQPADYDDEYQDVYGDDEDDDEDDDDEDRNGVEYLRKFDENVRNDIISQHHHELQQQNAEEIEALCLVVRNKQGAIIDPLHRTLPFLTKYEKARILGERAKQINSGAKPLVNIPKNMIDGYLIAQEEFKQKRIPFIVKRPLANGGCEYWKLEDLEVL